MTPSRIQQQRTKGWRKPEGAVAVHRSTRWGNPFSITKHHIWHTVGWNTTRFGTPPANASESMYRTTDKAAANWAATMYFYVYLRDEAPALLAAAHTEFAGRDLMCWCPPGLACHADVYLHAVNPGMSVFGLGQLVTPNSGAPSGVPAGRAVGEVKACIPMGPEYDEQSKGAGRHYGVVFPGSGEPRWFAEADLLALDGVSA